MEYENMVPHKGMFLTRHGTVTEDDEPELVGWEVMMQYELYEDRPDREKFHLEVFHRPEQKPFQLPYEIDKEGDATVSSTPDLDEHLSNEELRERLLELARESLESYASVLFLQGQST